MQVDQSEKVDFLRNTESSLVHSPFSLVISMSIHALTCDFKVEAHPLDLMYNTPARNFPTTPRSQEI